MIRVLQRQLHRYFILFKPVIEIVTLKMNSIQLRKNINIQYNAFNDQKDCCDNFNIIQGFKKEKRKKNKNKNFVCVFVRM